MLDKVEYWLELCDEDIGVAKSLVASKHHLQAGFFFHLVVEKALKAVIANIKNEIPPKTHHLIHLAERAGVFDDLSEHQRNLLGELNPLNIEARYPDHKARISQTLSAEKVAILLRETEDFLCWIKQRLEK